MGAVALMATGVGDLSDVDDACHDRVASPTRNRTAVVARYDHRQWWALSLSILAEPVDTHPMDGRPLALLTRTAPARATEAHIWIIGHITQTELRRHTTTVEIANGFLNRIVFHRRCLRGAAGARGVVITIQCVRQQSSTPRGRACKRAPVLPTGGSRSGDLRAGRGLRVGRCGHSKGP
jgi:hypothetical protein